MLVQTLTNTEKAQKLLSGCLYREQGHDTLYRLRATDYGHIVEQVHGVFGNWRECNAQLPIRDSLSIYWTTHNRVFTATIPLESIEILDK